jgi:hypothetical protein
MARERSVPRTSASPETSATPTRAMPPIAARVVLAPLAILAVVAVLWATFTMSHSVDTWVSLAGGRHVAAHGAGTADPFSFMSRQPGSESFLLPQGWINQNWLTHRLLAGVVGIGGFGGLVAWKLINYLLVFAVLLLAAHVAGARPDLSLPLAAGAILAGRAFFEVRAQDLTNLLAAALMLVLALAARRRRSWAWASIPLFALWANVHGGFVWGLLAVWMFAGFELLAGWRHGRLAGVRASTRGTWPSAALAATAACAVLSPYRLTNLLHPLEIAVGAGSAEWRTVLEWQPLTSAPVPQLIAFALAAAGAAAVWLAAFRRRAAGAGTTAARAHGEPLDGAGALLLAVTALMALVSRRFLPLTYLVGVPLVARWLTAIAPAWLTLLPTPAPRAADGRRWRLAAALGCWVLAAAAVIVFAVRFGRVYLGPWTVNADRTAIADRNLQTFRQPWEACTFVRAQALHGRMFSFWEEAGFWEWCQQPDAGDGRVPMQLLIDARAQGAYDIEAYRTYLDLVDGGPAGAAAAAAGRELTDVDLAAMRSHLATRLRELQIFLVHLPPGGLDSGLGRVALTLPGWEPIYVDAHHALVIDATTEQGKRLSEAVDAGTAEFPNEVAAALTRSYRLLRLFKPEPTRQAFALARRAYELEPSARAIGYVAASSQLPQLRPEVVRYCSDVVADLVTNGARHEREHGYFQRVMAATAATQFLADVASVAGDPRRQRWAADQLTFLAAELDTAEAAADW